MAKQTYFYLYVYKFTKEGKAELITGKLFFNKHIAIGIAENYCNITGYHAQIVTGNKIVFNR